MSEQYSVENILTIEEMIEKAGNHKYQWKMILNFSLVFLFSSFIQMGFPIFFQPAQFQCQPEQDCSQKALCERGTYTLSPNLSSVAYSFDLVCERQHYLATCFHAFLFGGFIGSLYYGQVLQRRGRRYAVIESLIMMVAGLYVSAVAGQAWIFSIGVFFFNAGFRGFYNASLLSISEVTNEVTRAATPMLFSIAWALGQIILAFVCILFSWRTVFLITAIPITILLYFSYKQVKDSPRFCVIKHQYGKAKNIVAEIAFVNEKRFRSFGLKQQKEHLERMQYYEKILQGGNISSRQIHHSYRSLFQYNSIRIRVILVSIIWSLISLSYFISANSQLDSKKSYTFNIALAGVIEIIAYFVSMLTSLNLSRMLVIKRMIIAAAFFHLLFYFVQPHNYYTGFSKAIVIILDILVRMIMSFGNTFLAIYSIELFPTSIRHFALGMLGFITKLMYMLSFILDSFFTSRYIHPNFIIGLLFVAIYPFTVKLRQTKENGFKDNVEEDGKNTLMNETLAEIF